MASPTAVSAQAPAKRLISLDVLRGLNIALMILVNTAGDGSASYAQLRHSVWNGCTLTDLVFPLFLFIMGVSMTLSFESRLAKGAGRSGIALQVVRRSATIFLLGLLLNALPYFQLATLRYCGVLQRIAICYLLGGIALLYLRVPGVAVLTAAAVSGYCVLLTKVPVPGYGVPGVAVGLLDPHGNLASFVDRMVIPQAHLYHQGFYDPEGLLSSLPALATTLLGVLTAAWFRRKSVSAGRRLVVLGAASLVLMALGLLWNGTFPFNKRLWTSSYVLYSGGINIGLFALLSWVLDERGWVRGAIAPWLIFGSNALTAYMFSEVLAIAIGSIPMRSYGTVQRFTFLLLPGWLGPAPLRSLLWSMLFVGVCFLPVWWMYRRRIFVKL